MRMPRAEDKVVVFIAVDGVPLRAEGVLSRVTLEARTMLNRSTGWADNSVRGSLTIELSGMREVAEESDVERIQVHGSDGVIRVYEVPAPDPLAMDEDDLR